MHSAGSTAAVSFQQQATLAHEPIIVLVVNPSQVRCLALPVQQRGDPEWDCQEFCVRAMG